MPNDATPPEPTDAGDRWMFLIDPAWDTERDGRPPAGAVVAFRSVGDSHADVSMPKSPMTA